ncbi:hypothetical protein HOY80DRAFT_1023369 [Tuber brumale]|nr:hypothetical protein HOY80DRAFT_1023369 [Tuber brumale]
MATQRATRSTSACKLSTTGSSRSPPPSTQRPATSMSSAEPLETYVDKMSLDESLETPGSENLSGEISKALEEMDISGERTKSLTSDSIGPGPGEPASSNSKKNTLLAPPQPTFDMDVGKFLQDRLDGHVTSYPRHTTPWPPGIYPAIPSTYTDGLEEHEFLWGETVVIEKKKFKTKPQSLKNLEKALTHLRSMPNSKNRQSEKPQKQSRAFKRTLRAHRLRLENLAKSAKRISDTVTEIYAQRQKHFFMTEDERIMAADVEMRAWRIRVAARGVRWFRHRAPAEYGELTRKLKEIILLETSRNKSTCRQLRERYQSVIWGQKGWKADVGLVDDVSEREEWDSERSEEGDELDEDDESEDTEDESEEDYDDLSPEHSNSHSSMRNSLSSRRNSLSSRRNSPSSRRNSLSSRRKSGSSRKKFPYIRLVFKQGSGEQPTIKSTKGGSEVQGTGDGSVFGAE